MKNFTTRLGQWPIGRSIEFTLAAVFWLAVAALAAGCTVVLKPAELAPLASRAYAALGIEAAHGLAASGGGAGSR